MKAGRELDALIAEHVMGPKVTLGSMSYWGSTKSGAKIYPYSEDIAAAFEVLEKLDEDLGGLQTEIEHHKNSAGVTLVWRVEPRYREVSAVADKLPEAICLAALKVKGIEP